MDAIPARQHTAQQSTAQHSTAQQSTAERGTTHRPTNKAVKSNQRPRHSEPESTRPSADMADYLTLLRCRCAASVAGAGGAQQSRPGVPPGRAAARGHWGPRPPAAVLGWRRRDGSIPHGGSPVAAPL